MVVMVITVAMAAAAGRIIGALAERRLLRGLTRLSRDREEEREREKETVEVQRQTVG